MKRTALQAKSQQRGAALMVLMMILGLLAAYFAISALNGGSQNERNRVNTKAMAQAKETLIGFAATYRDTHANQVFGYLPCPDIDNLPGRNGEASVSPSCPNQNISTTGRLPWNTLGLPALRDNAGECLWYAVSGSAKDVNKTAVFNWDTLGQFIVQDASGNVLAGGATGVAAHQRPLAVILAPSAAVNQTRAPSASECSGTTTLTSYLEGIGTPAPGPVSGITTITVATPASVAAGSNNDQAQWITSKDVFDRIRGRSDFRTDIDTLLNGLENCADNWPPTSLPPYSTSEKGLTYLKTLCPAADLASYERNLRSNWEDNLLYAKPSTPPINATIGGTLTPGCNAILIFGGTRLGNQVRDTTSNKGIAANYIEAPNIGIFPYGGNGPTQYDGLASFDNNQPDKDVVRCIRGLPASVDSINFNNPTADPNSPFSKFNKVGGGITTDDTSDPTKPSVTIQNGTGCFWYPAAITLAGKNLRIYYNFTFSFSDPTGGADRGNGFTFQMVRGDFGSPPSTCGTPASMGTLGALDPYGVMSYIVETDVHRDAANNDSVENHTAIMYGGNLTHSPTNGNLTTACNGSAAGCRHNPAYTFEEPATPTTHNQRIEVHSGCDGSCTNCNKTTPAGPNTRISVWVDCTDCMSISKDIVRSVQPPTINRCVAPPATPGAMNKIYFGLTGGFRTGASLQGVTIDNLYLGSE